MALQANNVIKSLAGLNATLLFIGFCKVTGWTLHNNSTGVRVVKLFDLGRLPLVGIDVPLSKIIIPFASTANQGTNFSEASFGSGVPFYNGLAYCVTGAVADLDKTAVSLDDVDGILDWTVRTD